MIDRLEGVVAGREPTSLRLQLGPVRLELTVPLTTSRRVEEGALAVLWTHLVWKEEGPALFGFASRSERDLFRLLLGVQGVGPMGALSLLSHLTPEDLLQQIRARSLDGLTRVPRIGQKTAGRILVDLGPKADRLILAGEGAQSEVQAEGPETEDAVQALAALGYASKEARKAVEMVLREDPDLALDECVRRSLLRLSRRAG